MPSSFFNTLAFRPAVPAAEDPNVDNSTATSTADVASAAIATRKRALRRRAQSVAPHPNSHIPIVIDSRGDLLVQVGEERLVRTFQVSAGTLARHSGVFDAMLYGGFTESKPDNAAQTWKITLPDDDPDWMEQLFILMHGKYQSWIFRTHSGPRVIELEHIYDFLVVVDKYDCIALVAPWAQFWCAWFDKVPAHTPTATSLYYLAWIYYQLGQTARYEHVVTELIYSVHPEATFKSPEVLPPFLNEIICNTRTEVTIQLLDTARFFIRQLTHEEKVIKDQFRTQRRDKDGQIHEDHACADRILGTLISVLAQHRLWPIPAAADVVKVSPQSVYAAFEAVVAAARGDHSQCVDCGADREFYGSGGGGGGDGGGQDPSQGWFAVVLKCRDSWKYTASEAEYAFMFAQKERMGSQAAKDKPLPGAAKTTTASAKKN
ncbi:uncharacterized protein B0I36DRAFT_381501 [Microdochium trichocladiopsis]|uniref:BTB domain-containing protein n=1 Tax=Microdochium trichocladiopsis TaxID=1682393 RepID=A0A9P8YAR4_9PEZI|nr:uncharacterized protein B0I36DRAFT_381501 [Microdochium trichocladiopsis]KAH7034599.1 hypothetical protein B0I36DRAFT_381501 [Microdochium trichocladiopsis]